MNTENRLGIQLHDYQEYAKDFIKERPYCGLFLDCGLGKTLITLMALYEMNPNGHVLVIAPLPIAKTTWQNEIDKWKIPLRTKSLIINERGKKLSRKKRLELYESTLDEPPTVYFINKELVSDLVKNMPVRNGKKIWPFPYVVVDELQSFKSHKAERFKSLSYVRPCIKRLIGLTGTPAPNGIPDLWSQIYLMDMGERLGKNITAYRDNFLEPVLYANGYPVKYRAKTGMEDVIYNKIKDLVISIKNDKIKLPDITYNNMYAEMDEKEYAMYKSFMKNSVLEFGEDDAAVAANAAVLKNKLLQMASGAIYLTENAQTAGKNRRYEIVHARKIEILDYIINTTGGPVLVAYNFHSDRSMLMEAFPDAECFDNSQEMQDRWNAGEIPVMLIQPKSSGMGINIQYGGHTLVWYTLTWSLEEYIQMNARLYRQGQTHPVMIHHIITKDTVDKNVLDVLQSKKRTEQALLEAVRAVIS